MTIPETVKYNKVTATYENAFDYSTISSATLHVPVASVEAYITSAHWGKFGSIVALTDEETAIKGIMSAQQDVQIYSPNGKKLNKLQKGLNIVKMRDGTIRKIVIK